MTEIAPSSPEPRRLIPSPIALASLEFQQLLDWPFSQEYFYTRQVERMLRQGLPHLIQYEDCALWGYFDSELNRELVGFGSLMLSSGYARYTEQRPHFYLPLLSTKPGIRSFGYGQFIVEHLVNEAAVAFSRMEENSWSDRIFLDVYTANEKACRLYTEKCGFETLNPDTPIPDPAENSEPYFVMARSLRIATTENAG